MGSLLEELARGLQVDGGQLTRKPRLSIDNSGDRVDVGLLGGALLVVGDRLERLLIRVKVRAANLLASVEDLLVEVVDALGGRLSGALVRGSQVVLLFGRDRYACTLARL